MEPVVVDCRSLPCPQPIIKLKRMFENGSPDAVLVMVDNDAAEENVSRFLKANGYNLEGSEAAGRWHIAARLEGGASLPHDGGKTSGKAETLPARAKESFKTLVLILAPVMGSGDDVLGAKLMKNFLATLPEIEGELWRVILLNGGVRLSIGASPVIKELQALEALGVSVLVCGACLEHFGLLETKAVGQTTNMLDVVTSVQLAEKVIRI